MQTRNAEIIQFGRETVELSHEKMRDHCKLVGDKE